MRLILPIIILITSTILLYTYYNEVVNNKSNKNKMLDYILMVICYLLVLAVCIKYINLNSKKFTEGFEVNIPDVEQFLEDEASLNTQKDVESDKYNGENSYLDQDEENMLKGNTENNNNLDLDELVSDKTILDKIDTKATNTEKPNSNENENKDKTKNDTTKPNALNDNFDNTVPELPKDEKFDLVIGGNIDQNGNKFNPKVKLTGVNSLKRMTQAEYNNMKKENNHDNMMNKYEALMPEGVNKYLSKKANLPESKQFGDFGDNVGKELYNRVKNNSESFDAASDYNNARGDIQNNLDERKDFMTTMTNQQERKDRCNYYTPYSRNQKHYEESIDNIRKLENRLDERFHNPDVFVPGMAYLPPSQWQPAYKMEEAKRANYPQYYPITRLLPIGTMDGGTPLNALEIHRDGTIAHTEDTVTLTNVGSILPKFRYVEDGANNPYNSSQLTTVSGTNNVGTNNAGNNNTE